VWQNLASIQLPIYLDRKSVMCVARDRLRHIPSPK
jgi:hypothetical protein